MARRNHSTDRHLGARVRFARAEKRISQTVLGEQLGVSFQQVQKYELGKDRISASQLMNIARVLEKDISFFFEDLAAEDSGLAAQSIEVGEKPRRSRVSMGYDIKIVRLVQAIEDERVKLRLFGLMEAIVGAEAGTRKPREAGSDRLVLQQ